MKFVSVTATIGVVAIAFLGGCSGVSPSSGTSAIPAAVYGVPANALPSGADSQFAGEPRLPQRFLSPQIAADPQNVLPIEQEFFISDAGSDVFVFKNSTYKKTATISKGLTDADGMWVDAKGNLYVANATGPNVLEYKKGAGTPVCRYSSKLSNPVNVTTDKSGNVYVADFGGSAVREYSQCSNKVKGQITINQPEGVAVDDKGNIFVAYFGPSGGNFEKFTDGTGKMLDANVTSPGGIILDKNNNLIADDQAGSIDLIKPPYASVKVLVRGLNDPFHASLNAKEDLLFNANAASSTVTIYTYPAMKLRKTITTSDGINAAEGVAESPNAIF